MQALMAQAEVLGQRLKDRKETVAVAESSSGGLISAALLGVPGASAYYLGGGVIYTPKARVLLMLALAEAARQGADNPQELVAGVRRAFACCHEV